MVINYQLILQMKSKADNSGSYAIVIRCIIG